MKKFVALLLCVILTFGTVSVFAELPKALTQPMTNYSGSYNVSVVFENSGEITDLLDELGVLEEVEKYVDLEELLKGLLSSETQMLVQADISKDFHKIKVGVTSTSTVATVINMNTSISADLKEGVWLDVDLDAAEPVCNIIYTGAFNNKYVTLDLFELIPEDQKVTVLGFLNALISEENLNNLSKWAADIFEKHSKVKISGSTVTLTMDNDGFIAMTKEIVDYILDIMEAAFGLSEGFVMPTEEELEEVYSILDNFKFLGKDGISCKYIISGGKLASSEMKMDFDFDIKALVEDMTGFWPAESQGKLSFTITEKVKVSKVGSTKVDFPKLTAENSVSAVELFDIAPEIPEEDENEYEYAPYPTFYAYVEMEDVPTIGDEYFVPLRALLEDAYGDSVVLDYNNGVITAESDYFTEFKMLKLTEDSGTVYADDYEINMAKIRVINGTTYVPVSFFEDIFGWELDELYYDMLNDVYNIGFYTGGY